MIGLHREDQRKDNGKRVYRAQMNGGRAGSEHIKDYPQSAYMYKRIDEFDRGKISVLGPHKMEIDGPCPR